MAQVNFKIPQEIWDEAFRLYPTSDQDQLTDEMNYVKRKILFQGVLFFYQKSNGLPVCADPGIVMLQSTIPDAMAQKLMDKYPKKEDATVIMRIKEVVDDAKGTEANGIVLSRNMLWAYLSNINEIVEAAVSATTTAKFDVPDATEYKFRYTRPNMPITPNGPWLPEMRELFKNADFSIYDEAPSLEQLFDQHGDFYTNVFAGGEVDATIPLKKMRQEMEELYEEVANNGTRVGKEFVDVLMCLVSFAKKAKLEWSTIKLDFAEKVEINKHRKWIQNADGTYSHVKEDADTTGPKENTPCEPYHMVVARQFNKKVKELLFDMEKWAIKPTDVDKWREIEKLYDGNIEFKRYISVTDLNSYKLVVFDQSFSDDFHRLISEFMMLNWHRSVSAQEKWEYAEGLYNRLPQFKENVPIEELNRYRVNL